MEFVPLVLWLVVYLFLAGVGLPLATRLFPRFATRGVGFALPISFVVLTLAGYWVGHFTFSIVAPVVALVVLLGLSAAFGLDRSALRDGRLELVVDVDRDVVVDSALVFVVAFAFLLSIRAVDPSIHAGGGEKYLDFGLLRTLLRAPRLPPTDMWFAGESLRYYYGGHLAVALLSKLTGVGPAYAYNLGLVGFYAMLLTAAYDLAASINAARGGSRRIAGLLAAFFVGFASNLVTSARLVLLWLPEPYRSNIARSAAEQTAEFSTQDILAGAESFNYWPASRVIPGTINEFPLFSWLNGDLHAHMMGTVFLLLGAAIAYSYFQTPSEERGRRWALLFVVLPLLGSFQVVTDTWSFPSIFGVTFLALVFAPTNPLSILPSEFGDRLRTFGDESVDRESADGGSVDAGPWLASETGRVLGALVLVASSAGLAAVLSLPFLLGSASGAGRELAFLTPDMRSALAPLLLVHGAFVAAFAAFLYGRLGVRRRALLVVALAVFGGVALLQQFAALAVFVPLLVFGWLALRMDRDVGYETVLVVAGTGLLLIVEFVYIKEQAGPGRMNTVFKTYMQVWVLWGTAMGVVLPNVVRGPATSMPRLRPRTVRTVLGSALVVALVLSTSVYGALAVGQHFAAHSGETTLDGTAFMSQQHPDEGAAIEWLDGHATRETTMLSAPATSIYPNAPVGSYPFEPGMYAWDSSPAASLTGVPTVAGWYHEVGYRGYDAYYGRMVAVDDAYTGSNAELAETLVDYDVEYVWVGSAERGRYGDALTLGDESYLEPAFQSGDVTIYRVDEQRAAAVASSDTTSAS